VFDKANDTSSSNNGKAISRRINAPRRAVHLARPAGEV
jgi:hypothetical protein